MSATGEIDIEAKVIDSASSNLDNIKNKMGEVGEAAKTTARMS
jgi:precorrin-4 methylase